MHATLLIFAKYPHPGTVKTRLAATIGDTVAAQFYTQSAEYTILQAHAVGEFLDIHICYSDARDEDVMKQWMTNIGLKTSLIPQFGSTLGERMQNAIDSRFHESPTEPVLVISTDTPDISADVLRSALTALTSKDIVLGPAVDGGYYLIGMNQYYPSLFDDIAWSSPMVAIQTIQKAEELNLNIALLDPLIDIDTLPDLRQWLRLESTASDHPLYALAHQLITHE